MTAHFLLITFLIIRAQQPAAVRQGSGFSLAYSRMRRHPDGPRFYQRAEGSPVELLRA